MRILLTVFILAFAALMDRNWWAVLFTCALIAWVWTHGGDQQPSATTDQGEGKQSQGEEDRQEPG